MVERRPGEDLRDVLKTRDEKISAKTAVKTNALARQQNKLTQQFASIFFELQQLFKKPTNYTELVEFPFPLQSNVFLQ